MKLKNAIPSLAAAVLAAVPIANAQNATTDPVGFVTATIAASNDGVSYSVTPISPVLVVASAVTGSTLGSVSALTADTITVSSAGWTVSQLPSSDVYVLFKTGNLTGLILPVTANTVDTLTVATEGLDLSASGAQVGNSIQLVQGDTLLSMFGTPADGVVGGNATQFSATATDRVSITDAAGSVRTFYFNTEFNQWRRTGSSSNQGGTRISPSAGAFYSRIGQSALSMTSTGAVPTSAVKYVIPTSGSKYIARFFPTDGTISSFGFQNLASWRSTNQPGVTTADADKIVTIDGAGSVRTYFFNGTNWRRSGSGANQDNVAVPPGGSVMVTRFGTGPADIVNVAVPYSL
ncbi:MAG: hypothetical protein KGR46_05565 [Verrucomicrobia bacterium]|nr:hypothetical protein [Verrucomicrobiota bacterium]